MAKAAKKAAKKDIAKFVKKDLPVEGGRSGKVKGGMTREHNIFFDRTVSIVDPKKRP